MRQVLQDLGSGATRLVELPLPDFGPGELLIRSSVSLISSGTERMLVEFGRGGLLEKARQQPDKVRQVIDKMRTDGVLETLDAVRSKLDQPVPLGYSNVGTVVAVGDDVTGFEVGDRVASNGAHAEFVVVPQNLCARVPSGVDDESAAFTVVGAIALQGIRLVQPSLGECVVVTGLGLIGLVTVQLLRAQGCRVLGIDFDDAKLARAREYGAEVVNAGTPEAVLSTARQFARGRGVDAVLITAATKSNEPIEQAAAMCRKRGRIVLVGVAGLELSRAAFFEKELTFQVSCSYGPGRYDPDYESKGRDYPVGYVRWTEGRNFEAVLDSLADGGLEIESLISHRFDFGRAPDAYDLLAADDVPHLGILLDYRETRPDASRTTSLRPVSERESGPEHPALAVIGAGNYAGRVLIPAFGKAGAELRTLVNRGGASGVHYAKKHGFANVSTDVEQVMEDGSIDAIVIATRHDSHARLVERGLAAGKHVFCEKPLALSLEELDRIEEAWRHASAELGPRQLMVGFNRRFAPLVGEMRRLLDEAAAPLAMHYMVNAGALPEEHWAHDPAVGGGRIVGEACHFVDLLRFLARSRVDASERMTLRTKSRDTATLQLSFENGSIGTVTYWANGHRSFPKERLEVFCDGRILQLDNFRELRGFGWSSFRSKKLRRQDKGQEACVAAFLEAIRGHGAAPVPVEELLEVSRLSVKLAGDP